MSIGCGGWITNLIRQVVAVLDEPVPQGDLGDSCGRLWCGVFAHDEVGGLLQQSLGTHLPDDPAEQGGGG